MLFGEPLPLASWSLIAWNKQLPSLGVCVCVGGGGGGGRGVWGTGNKLVLRWLFPCQPSLDSAWKPFCTIHCRFSGRSSTLFSVVDRTNKSLAISFRILSSCSMSSALFAKIKFLASKQVKTPQSFTFFRLGHLGVSSSQLSS